MTAGATYIGCNPAHLLAQYSRLNDDCVNFQILSPYMIHLKISTNYASQTKVYYIGSISNPKPVEQLFDLISMAHGVAGRV